MSFWERCRMSKAVWSAWKRKCRAWLRSESIIIGKTIDKMVSLNVPTLVSPACESLASYTRPSRHPIRSKRPAFQRKRAHGLLNRPSSISIEEFWSVVLLGGVVAIHPLKWKQRTSVPLDPPIS